MTALAHRPWVPAPAEATVGRYAVAASGEPAEQLAQKIEDLAERNRRIHEHECFNLNPATNVMNPRAEAMLSAGLGTRPSLGYPGDKYETGLEAIEEIEVISAELAAEVFGARYAEIRVHSGAMANLAAFMATCKPGDAVIVPPASIGGHVTHHQAGAAGLYGLEIHEMPVNADEYTVDVEALATMAFDVRPELITLGGSLNLFPHPTAAVARIAEDVGARLMVDAAHQCGMFAGRVWPDPLADGAHIVTMSTYKSLGGPAGGLILSNDAEIAERIDRIVFPGLTANFDAGRTAALAICMLDWREFGHDYAHAMVDLAKALAAALDDEGVPVFAKEQGFTRSHQFAVEAARYGGGQTAAKKLREAGFLACGIGLPLPPVENDMNGLRIGTPELARWGVMPVDIPAIASLIALALESDDPAELAPETARLRRRFDEIHYILD